MKKIKRIIRLLVMVNFFWMVISPNAMFAVLLLIFSSTRIGICIGEYKAGYGSRSIDEKKEEW